MIYFVFRDANLKLSYSKVDYIFNVTYTNIKPKKNTDQINLSYYVCRPLISVMMICNSQPKVILDNMPVLQIMQTSARKIGFFRCL